MKSYQHRVYFDNIVKAFVYRVLFFSKMDEQLTIADKK